LKPVLKLPPVQRLSPVDAIDVIFAGKKTNIGTTGFKGIEFLFPFFLCHEQNHAQAPYPFRHAHVVRQHDDKRLELGI
jgi:hypothetical protein